MSTLRCTLVPAKIIGLWLALLFFFLLFEIYLFMSVLSLHPCCMGFSLVLVSGGYSLVLAHGLLIAGASLVAEHGP